MQNIKTGLAALAGLFGLIAAGGGLFWPGDGSPFEFTTLHGEQLRMYGQGLYRNDTYFKAAILRGTDGVTLFVCVPLLVWAIVLARRGSPRGELLLIGILSFFLYNSISLAMGVAFNDFFLVYVLYFSASLFAFLVNFTAFDREMLAGRASHGGPHRSLAAFMVLAGLSVFVWFIDIVGARLEGTVPVGLASYTTEVTYVLDLGIIAPTAFLGAVLVWQRRPLGYLIAATILILNALVGVLVVGQSISQSMAQIPMTLVEFVAFIGVFLVMSLIAAWFVWQILRRIPAEDATRAL